MKKILIMGTGAVGGYFGSRLAEAGHEVYFAARGLNLKVIQDMGLNVDSVHGKFHRHMPVSDNPASFGIQPDLIIMAVKSFDTRRAIQQLKPVVGLKTQILSLQNGVENAELLINFFGKNRVIRGFCRLGAELVRPGHIIQQSFGDITFGEDTGERSERIADLDSLLRQAGIESIPSKNIQHDSWIKFTWNSVFNVLTGLLNVHTSHLFTNEATLDLMWRMFREIQAVAAANSVNLTDKEFEKALVSTKKLGDFKTSTQQDRIKGKMLEFDAFTGAMVRMGARHGISVPEYQTLDALYRVL